MAVNSSVPPRVTPTTGEHLECSPACYSDYGGTVGGIQLSDTRYQGCEKTVYETRRLFFRKVENRFIARFEAITP